MANLHSSTPLIKPNFCILLPHRRSTTVSLETTPFVQRFCQLLESLYGGQFTLSIPLIKPKNFCVLLPHQRSTTVSLETVSLETVSFGTTPFIHFRKICLLCGKDLSSGTRQKHQRPRSAWVRQEEFGKLELNNRNIGGYCRRLSMKRD